MATAPGGRARMKAGRHEGWYLKCTQGEIAERVILVGDPARVDVYAGMLESPRTVNKNRALVAVTGAHNGNRISVVSFGMGSPVLAVVLEEISWLGARLVLRAGTALAIDSQWFGKLIIAEGAFRGESTSLTYVPAAYPAISDSGLSDCLMLHLKARNLSGKRVLMGSYDGFFTEIVALDPRRQEKVQQVRADLQEMGIAAVDMETSALLTIGRVLGLRCASMCLVTVDGSSLDELTGEDREAKERELVEVSLEGITECSLDME